MSKFKIFVICIILCIFAIFSFWLFHKNNIKHTTNSKENLESIKNKEDKFTLSKQEKPENEIYRRFKHRS